MQNYSRPNRDDLNVFVLLIRLLRQVHSHMQDINDEAERFNVLLGKQRELVDQHRSDIEDLTYDLSDYEDQMEQVLSIGLTERLNSHYSDHMASIVADRESHKEEG